MADRPIIFSGSMVRALLDGRKTQTRRVLKPQPKMLRGAGPFYRPHPVTAPREWHALHGGYIAAIVQVRYAVGDRLWVRESGWERPERTQAMMRDGADTWEPFYFDADGIDEDERDNLQRWGFKRRPSIHMPRWASRLTLTVTDVRVQRLQEISEEDARAEGVRRIGAEYTAAGSTAFNNGPNFYTVEIDAEGWSFNQPTARDFFAGLWRHLHDDAAWAANPWVAAISFTVERRNIDAKEGQTP